MVLANLTLHRVFKYQKGKQARLKGWHISHEKQLLSQIFYIMFCKEFNLKRVSAGMFLNMWPFLKPNYTLTVSS